MQYKFFINIFKYQIISLIFILFYIYSCNWDLSEPILLHRSKVIVETDLDSLRIGNRIITKDTLYTILDIEENSALSVRITIYPVIDTGFIKFRLYSGTAFDYPIPVLRDSLTLYTPIDTTQVVFQADIVSDTIIVM